MLRVATAGPPALALSKGNRKRKREVPIHFLDLPNDVMYLIFFFAIKTYNDACKMQPVCSVFHSMLKRVRLFGRLLHQELAYTKSKRCIVGFVPHCISGEEHLFKARYKYVPYVKKQPLLTMIFRSQCVTLFRTMAFSGKLRIWPSRTLMTYPVRVVAFHRSVSLFDRFCIGLREELSYTVSRKVVCACSFLGFESNHTTRRGKFYFDQHMQLLDSAGWNIPRLQLLDTLELVASVITTSDNPRVRGDGRFRSAVMAHDATRGLFHRSKLNHEKDFSLLNCTMQCLSHHPKKDKCYYMCMYLLDLVQQSELAFYPKKEEVAHAVYLYAWQAFPSVPSGPTIDALFRKYGGFTNTCDLLRPHFYKLTKLRDEARTYKKHLHEQYARQYFKCVSTLAKEKVEFFDYV